MFELLLHSFPLRRDPSCKYFSPSGCSSLHLGDQTVEREVGRRRSICVCTWMTARWTHIQKEEIKCGHVMVISKFKCVFLSLFDWSELIRGSHRSAGVEAPRITPSRHMHCVFRKVLKISFTFLISKDYRVLTSRHGVSSSDQMVYIFQFLWQQPELG